MKELSIKVLGAGPSGSLLAIALANSNTKVYLFDILDMEKLLSRDRSYAITHSTRRLLEKLGIWSELKNKAIPFKELSVLDSVINKSIVLSTKDLNESNYKSNAVGWTIDHKILMEVLFEKINISNQINLQLNCLKIKDDIDYDYHFAADGISSKSRNKWNIGTYSYIYRQKCITFKALLRVNHSNRAYEIFRKEGPMAILPMGNDLYQVVISSPSSICENLITLPTSLFLDKVSTLLPSGIEIDSLYNNPEVFPLALSVSKKLIVANKFLVGESAHSLHPVGGQGLNLSIRDINALTLLLNDRKNRNHIGLISKRSKSFFILNRYIDILSTSFLTHILIVIFSNSFTVFRFIRYLTFILLRKAPYLRRLLLSLFTDGFSFLFAKRLDS